MGLKQQIKRKTVKLHRRIFGKPKEIVITTGEDGLTKNEIEDTLATLFLAMKQGKLSPMSYEYRPPSIISKREELILIPKTVSVATARAQVRKVLRNRYGTRYIVDNPTRVVGVTKTPSVGRIRITPKRPRIS